MRGKRQRIISVASLHRNTATVHVGRLQAGVRRCDARYGNG